MEVLIVCTQCLLPSLISATSYHQKSNKIMLAVLEIFLWHLYENLHGHISFRFSSTSPTKSPVSFKSTHQNVLKILQISPFENLQTDSVYWFSLPFSLKISWKLHRHNLRHGCNSSHSRSISISFTASSINSYSTSNIEILYCGQLNIPLVNFRKF